MKQTILGSGGAIGIPLAKELKNFTSEIRLVSRKPKKVNDTDELYPLDLNDLRKLPDAIKGSAVVYLTIGFEYNLKIWQERWPRLMRAVIEACQLHGAKLVFGLRSRYVHESTPILNGHFSQGRMLQV